MDAIAQSRIPVLRKENHIHPESKKIKRESR
jgi:hypothetical protein